MRFYKIISEGYILYVGVGEGGIEITETEYNGIMEIIRNKPEETSKVGYRLKTDLTWEQYEKQPEPEPEPDADELLNILTGEEP